MLSFSTSRNLWIFACLFLSFAGCERHGSGTDERDSARQGEQIGETYTWVVPAAFATHGETVIDSESA